MNVDSGRPAGLPESRLSYSSSMRWNASASPASLVGQRTVGSGLRLDALRERAAFVGPRSGRRHRCPSSSAIGCDARAAHRSSSHEVRVDPLDVVRLVGLEQQERVGPVVRTTETGEEVRVTGRDDAVDGQPAGVTVVGMQPVALPRVVTEHDVGAHLA